MLRHVTRPAPARAFSLVAASVAAIFIGAVSGTARAADLPATKGPPSLVAAPLPTWTGFYAGGNIGYGWDSGSMKLPISTTDPLFSGFIDFANEAGLFPAALSPSAHGAAGGGQLGFNWQWAPNWLVGVEADIQGSRIKGSTSRIMAPMFSDVTETGVSKSIEWFGTARARVGFLPHPQLLLYATGGLAYGETKLTFNTTDVTSGCIPDATICATGRSSGVRTGWTLGGGLEAMLLPNWSFKAEYLYVDLGRRRTQVAAYSVPFIVFSPSAQFREQIVRVGLNYHFY